MVERVGDIDNGVGNVVVVFVLAVLFVRFADRDVDVIEAEDDIFRVEVRIGTGETWFYACQHLTRLDEHSEQGDQQGVCIWGLISALEQKSN